MEALLRKIKKVFAETEFENKIWLVGGIVRDELLGIAAADPDIMIEGSACDAVLYLCKKGIGQNPVYLPEYNTAKVYADGYCLELTGARSDKYTRGSRRPEVMPASLTEDAFRRDLTINALYKNLHTDEIKDPTGMGLEDIKKRIIRTPAEPYKSFCEDPLRILRTLRFLCISDFSIDLETEKAIIKAAAELEFLSKERIAEEIIKIMKTPDPSKALNLMQDDGVFKVIIPELCPLKGLNQGSHHIYDAWEHTVKAIGFVSEPLLRLALLFHDVSKPLVKTIDEKGEIKFPSHAAVSAEMAEKILTRLHFSVSDIKYICRIIESHSAFFKCKSDSEFREIIHRYRDISSEIIDIAEADKKAAHPVGGPIRLEKMKETYKRVFEPCLLQNELSPLSGNEIAEITGKKGPEIGTLKQKLRNMVIAGELAFGDKEKAKNIIKGKD